MSLPTDTEINDAIRRIAMTADGRLLYRRLQLELMRIEPSAEASALQASHGRRLLARELKLLMDEELAKLASDRVRPNGEHDPDEPAVVERPKPVAVAAGGSRRRVEPYADDPKST